MNKICIETSEFDLKITSNEDYFLEIKKALTLKVSVCKNVQSKIIFLSKDSSIDLDIELLEFASLDIQGLGINTTLTCNTKENENSNLKSVISIASYKDSCNKININMASSNSNCNFFLNGVNLENNKLYFTVNGIINKNLENVLLEENTCIINRKDGDSKIIPNLLVDSDSTVANHSAFIGKLDDEVIRYLNSRGIEDREAKKILLRAVLLGKMDLGEAQEEFRNLLNLIID